MIHEARSLIWLYRESFLLTIDSMSTTKSIVRYLSRELMHKDRKRNTHDE